MGVIIYEDIIHKVTTYGNSSSEYEFIVNRGKVNIIVKNKLNIVKNMINSAHTSYSNIKCSNKAKITGHITTPTVT